MNHMCTRFASGCSYVWAQKVFNCHRSEDLFSNSITTEGLWISAWWLTNKKDKHSTWQIILWHVIASLKILPTHKQWSLSSICVLFLKIANTGRTLSIEFNFQMICHVYTSEAYPLPIYSPIHWHIHIWVNFKIGTCNTCSER